MSKYQITEQDDAVLVVFVSDSGSIHTAQNDNPQLQTIIDRLRAKDTDGIETLFSMEAAVAATFAQLSERVTLKGGRVLFDGDPVDDTIEGIVLRAYDAGKVADYVPVVNFMEKVYANTSEHTRTNLFNWLLAEEFSITSVGDIVAYKGLRSDGTSVHAGPATVDGKDVNGHVPNVPGSVIEIRRSDVVADPRQGCAYGLHAGTYEYASGFGSGLTMEVHVNPRDVVSVPTDCNAQKMRVARYRVVQPIEGKYSAAVVPAHDLDNDFEVEYSIPVF